MRIRITKEQQLEIIKQYQSGKGSDTIALQFNIHPNTVLKVLKRNNIDRREAKRKIDLIEFPKIVEMYKDGKSSPQIADIYKVSHSIILKILEKQNCERRDADDTHRKYAIREDYFDNIDTPEKAYILGFTYADGCNVKQGNYISYDLNTKDIDLLYKIAERIYIDDPHDRIRNYKRTKEHKGEIKVFNSSVLAINSKYVCEVLEKLGCEPRKSLTTKFPEWLTDKELQRHFIRGYYDGDGGVYITTKKERGAIAKIIGTKSFMNNVSEIIRQELNIYSCVEIISDDLQRISISGNQQVRHFLNWLYEGSTIHMDRKYNLYKQLLDNMDENSRTRKTNNYT